ncbi:MAG: methylmalonyl Co-A mutase-associated GTPase MeaB [Bacteroidales bacterium]
MKKPYKGNIEESKREGSALHINDGVDHPPQINPHLQFKRAQPDLKAADYIREIENGDRNVLGKAITLIESTRPDHKKLAQEIIRGCVRKSGKSIRIGITGVPGVGKSSLIESLGQKLVTQGHKLAVLAIDPSSERSKGSILGDKTRMNLLSQDENAFIRPSPSAGSLGGVARKTRESIILCEAAGFDTIFIETVGVGQSETAVHSMVDFFLLLMLAGAGDELQGIKRGIMEMSDTIVINKADDNNIRQAKIAQNEYRNALHLYPPSPSGWVPKVLTCSSLHNTGIDKVWDTIMEYVSHTKGNGYFDTRRKQQALYWIYETINENLKSDFYNDPSVKENKNRFENDVLEGKMTSFEAAYKLLDLYFQKKNNNKS